MARLVKKKSQLSPLLEKPVEGHEVMIVKAGVPRKTFVRVRPPAVPRPGGAKSRTWIAADFDAPLPADLLAGFSGKS
jgi:hypothetical protein